MSLEIVEALKQEQLAQALCERLAVGAGEHGPLCASTVVIQNTGLGRWLQLRQASLTGISAGLKLPLARSFIAQELERVGLFQRRDALEAGRLRWQIFELLLRREFADWGEWGAPLLRYLDASHPKLEQRCWQLAGQLADLYDQYAMYRPAWVLSWLSEGASAISAQLPHARWQIELLRAIQAKQGWDAAAMGRRLLGLALYHYTQGQGKAATDTTPIHVFGVSTFPPAFLGFFKRLAAERTITVYHLVCSEAYLGELPKSYRAALTAAGECSDALEPESGLVDNPLLIQSGQATARFQSLLLALDYPIGELSLPPAHQSGSDLECLQRALRANQPSLEQLRADGTLSIHSCHSPIREVQVLQQQLLALFAADPDLRPEDILVLAPEIADYADAIESVFGQAVPVRADGCSHKIPYCIADRLAGHDEHCWRFFESLLSWLQGRQTFSALAAVLDFDPVCRQLGVSRDELKELLVLLQQVGIRWGIDGAARVQQGQPEFEAYSWDYGLQRLYDGQIFPDAGYESLAPVAMSRRMAEIVGALTQLLRRAFRLVRTRGQRRSFQQWMDVVLAVVRDCVGESERGDSWYAVILPALGDVNQLASEEPISFETFCEVALGAKQEPSGPSGLLRRGVTFCRMQPVRHIPAKVLCVLGLNEGAYPRQPKRIEFDLIQQQRRLRTAGESLGPKWSELEYLGDRRLRDEDRQLLLDCLLNARERLYLSYVGQSDTDQQAHPPSLLLSELQQFLALPAAGESREERALKLQTLQLRHPLQEWSRRNFECPQPAAGEPPVSLHFELELAGLRQQLQAPTSFLEQPLPATIAESTDVIPVARLLRFLKDPAEDFLRQQLQVNLNQLEWEQVFEDEECLDGPDALQAWALRQQVLDDWLAARQQPGGLDPERYRQQLQRSLHLPLGRAGEASWCEQVLPLLNFLQQAIGTASLHKRENRRQLSAQTLVSEDWYTDSGLRLILLNGTIKAKKAIDFRSASGVYLQHLCATGVSRVLCLKDLSVYEISAELSGSEAWLDSVLEAWRVGQSQPLPFSCKIAQYFAELQLQRPDEDALALLEKAYAEKWEVNALYQKFGDDSPAQRLCFDGDSPAAPGAIWNAEFVRCAQTLLTPVLEWGQQLEPGETSV